MISNRTRWLAIGAGLFTALASIPAFGAGFALFVSSFLILGASVQPRFPRAGRGLICAGAIWLTFWVFDIFTLMLLEKGGTNSRLFVLVMLASVLLVVWCDVAIAAEELKIRRIDNVPKQLFRA